MNDRLAIMLRHKWLPSIAAITLVALLLFGLLLPVYADEVDWRFAERAAIDGFDKQPNDSCGPSSMAVPPWFMMPVRYYSAWLNQLFPDPFYVRISGVLYALILLTMVWRLVARITPQAEQRRLIQTICVSLLGLATLPLLLVMSRPEQPILLSLLAALLLAFRPPSSNTQTIALRCLGVLACACIALSYHMKGVLLAPAFAFCLLLCGSGRKSIALRGIAITLLIAAAVVAARYWVGKVACPGNPALAAVYAKMNVSALLSQGNGISGAFHALAQNANVLIYLMRTAPDVTPTGTWVIQAVSQAQMVNWRIGLFVIWLPITVLTAIGIGRGLITTLREKRLDARPILALLILSLTLAWGMTQTVKNVYESGFIVPLWIVVVALGLATGQWGRRLVLTARILALAMGISGALLVATYLPSFARAAHSQAYLGQQLTSQSVFGYGAAKPRIMAAAKLCGIGAKGRPQALLIDDVTYFAFMGSHRPQQDHGVLGLWSAGIGDPVRYLKSVGSDGAILGCHFLPPALRGRAKRVGEFCCLSPPNW